MVSEDALTAWQLYRAHFAGGMAPGPLPFGGGYAEQPACVAASFDVIAAVESALAPKKQQPKEQ